MKLFGEELRLKHLPKSSNQEPALVGSNASNDYSAKRTDECPSKHYQAGRDGWKKSVVWARKEDDNTKGDGAGWPGWETVSNRSCEKYSRPDDPYDDESTMACKRGWNESEAGNAKRVTEGGEAFNHDGLGERRQPKPNIHMVHRGSLSKSACWDRPTDGNGKLETGGWPRWPGALSKTTRQCPSHQNKKNCWNQSEERTASEDGSTMENKRGWNASGGGRGKRENGNDTFEYDGRDGWRKSCSNIHVVDKGSLRNSASWDRAKYENVKRENDGWPGWPGAMSKTTRQQCTSHQNRKGCRNQSEGWTTSEDSTMACARSWNESGVGKEKKGTVNGSDSFDHDGRDGCRPSSSNFNMVDKSRLSKFASQDRANGDNAKRGNDGWPRWPGAMSKTIGQFPSHQTRKVGWQSQGWTVSDVGDSQKETGCENPDLVHNGDPWMQHGSVMLPKCDWNTPVTCNASKSDSLDRDQRKWDPGLDQTDGDPWNKAGRRKFGSGTVVQGENFIKKKSKWSGAPDFSDSDASKQHRLRWGASSSSTSGNNGNQDRKGGWNQSWGRIASEQGDSLKENNGRITDLDQTGRDPWEQPSPSELPKFGKSFRERIKLGSASDFGDPNTLKQNMHAFLPKNDGKMPFRDRSRTSYHASEHEHYQSNDTCKKGAGVSAYYGDCSSGRSQSGSQVRNQVGDSVRKHPDRADEFCGSKKARYLRTDRRIDSKDPRKQRDHVPNEDFRELDVQISEELCSSRQLILHGMLQNKSSDCKWDQTNTGNASSWNVPKVSKTIVEDSHGQSHLRRDDGGYRDDIIKSMVTTPKQNVGQNVTNSSHVCQQSTQNLASHFDDRTDHATSLSPIQFGRNIQVGHLHPSGTKSSNPNAQSQLPVSNPKDEVGNHEQQAKLNIHDSSTTEVITLRVASSAPAFVQANEDPSSSNLCSRFSPAIIGQKTSITPEELKTSSKKPEPAPTATVPPSGKILDTGAHFVKQEPQASGVCNFSSNLIETMSCPNANSKNTCHSEAMDVQVHGESSGSKHEKEEMGANWDKEIRMFKIALAEFVKEILKPAWKEGRLSKEAHKTVVKKAVDKVVGVLGTNVPQTQERIDQYLSYAKEKLHKLVQDYLEMFINT